MTEIIYRNFLDYLYHRDIYIELIAESLQQVFNNHQLSLWFLMLLFSLFSSIVRLRERTSAPPCYTNA